MPTAISVLTLPPQMPVFTDIRAPDHNEVHYDPTMWEMFYKASPYLKRSTDDAVRARYETIVRNLEVLVDPGRHRIPIQSFLSSWYWYRKEHEARLELHLRNVSVPIDSGTIVPGKWRLNAPVRAARPNSGTVLFRFTYQSKARELVDRGALRIRRADDYAKGAAVDPRTDNEREKVALIAGERVHYQSAPNHIRNVRGDLQRTVSFPPYYLASYACDYSSLMLSEFNYDSYVLILDGDEFCRRFEAAAARQAPDCLAHHNPIEYFDPFDHTLRSHLDPTMSKDFRFAWQAEYRFLLVSRDPARHVPQPHIDLDLGPLHDIATVRFP